VQRALEAQWMRPELLHLAKWTRTPLENALVDESGNSPRRQAALKKAESQAQALMGMSENDHQAFLDRVAAFRNSHGRKVK